MAENSAAEVRHLRQGNAVWLCTARRAPYWIFPKHRPPYRPYVVMVLDQDSHRILRAHTQDERPTPDLIWHVLVTAMRSGPEGPLLSRLAGFASRYRPAGILLDNTEQVQALAPRLSQAGIHCDYRVVLPPVTAALRTLEASTTRRKPVPGLLSLPGATVPLVGEFFAAAADYHRLAPWRWMNNRLPIEIRYPSRGRARFALVLGSGGETFGLSLYGSLADIRQVYSGVPVQQRAQQFSCFSLVLDDATAMSFDDLDAMEQYGWPVAGEAAYPLAIKSDPTDEDPEIPSASELFWLTAAVRAIPDFVVRYLHADRGAPRPAQVIYSLAGVHGGQDIFLRYPAQERLMAVDEKVSRPSSMPAVDSRNKERTPDNLARLELAEFIRDWSYDERSRDFARRTGMFLLGFIEYLESQGLTRQTLRKHADNCWWLGKFECEHDHPDTCSPAIFLGGPKYLNEFKSQVSDSKSAVNSYRSTWRKLERYVQSGAGYAGDR